MVLLVGLEMSSRFTFYWFKETLVILKAHFCTEVWCKLNADHTLRSLFCKAVSEWLGLRMFACELIFQGNIRFKVSLGYWKYFWTFFFLLSKWFSVQHILHNAHFVYFLRCSNIILLHIIFFSVFYETHFCVVFNVV